MMIENKTDNCMCRLPMASNDDGDGDDDCDGNDDDCWVPVP